MSSSLSMSSAGAEDESGDVGCERWASMVRYGDGGGCHEWRLSLLKMSEIRPVSSAKKTIKGRL